MTGAERTRDFEIYAQGDAALSVRFISDITDDTHRRVMNLWRAVEARRLEFVVECVPAFTSVTIFYDLKQLHTHAAKSNAAPLEYLVLELQNIVAHASDTTESNTEKIIEIPVCYDDDFAPDMMRVMMHRNLTREQVIALHTSTAYTVFMLGFAPGFAYLGGLPPELHTPRLDAPRLRVPAGSVAIGGAQTGVYPLATAGGWNIIGRTPLALCDFTRTPPTLLDAGDTVRFISITRREYEHQEHRRAVR